MWFNHIEALDKIQSISKKDNPLHVIRKELADVLSMTEKKSYQKVLDWVISSYEKATWYIEKRNLQFASPFINDYISKKSDDSEHDWSLSHEKEHKNTQYGIVKLIRESDSTWKYRVYKYTVKNGWNTKDIKKQYEKQIWWDTDGIKITDEYWKEYPSDKKFSKWTNVYIKVPKKESLEYLDKLDDDIKEKIKIQEDYISTECGKNKEVLENFNKQHPMWKDVEISFWIPVKEYEDIDKTLHSITEWQTLDPQKYEVVLLLNRPNNKTDFDKKTKEKILKFKLAHPEYSIHLFEHTFDFSDKAKMWEIYKLLWDTIIYRNVQRKNIKWMDMKKVRNLIMKTWWADSTEKNPDYLKNQIEKYSKIYNWKELIRLTWESRIPADVAQAYPLVEIDEFFQRFYDLEYVWWDPLKRDVWIWSYKAWGYCSAWWFEWDKYVQEDTWFVKRIKRKVASDPKCCMYHDKDFIWAVDNSTDRWICSIVHGIPYCDRYNWKSFKWKDDTKKIERNKWAVSKKWTKETECLELNVKNLWRDLSALYKQKFEKVYKKPEYSNKYKHFLDLHKNIKDNQKKEWLLSNVINPIIEKVLSKPDFMWLDKNDYSLLVDREWNPQIKFKESAIEKIKRIQQKKIRDWYYDYRK